MPALKPISREYRIYLALWRKAYLAPENAEPIVIKVSSRNMAIAMRQGMYRAIRPFRYGDQSDEQLRMAAEKFVIYLAPKGAKDQFIELKPRKTLEALSEMFDELGVDEEDLLLGDERTATIDLKKFLDEQTAEPPRNTPFYQREE